MWMESLNQVNAGNQGWGGDIKEPVSLLPRIVFFNSKHFFFLLEYSNLPTPPHFCLMFSMKLVFKIFVQRFILFVIIWWIFHVCFKTIFILYLLHIGSSSQDVVKTIFSITKMLFASLIWLYSGNFQRFVICGDNITTLTANAMWTCAFFFFLNSYCSNF